MTFLYKSEPVRGAIWQRMFRGWGRTQRDVPGVECFAGMGVLADCVAGCDILICVVPLTPETQGILNADLFAALDGQLSAAVLDVFDAEPLPTEDPLWSPPRLWLTPHIASTSQPEGGAEAVIANIHRDRRGENWSAWSSATAAIERHKPGA